LKSVALRLPDNSLIPSHVAFIVDGNGRWALEKGMSRQAGHDAGANVTGTQVICKILWLYSYALC